MELLHICVRRTLPWHDEAEVAAALRPEMRPKVEVWNATFNLRYAAFRLRLRSRPPSLTSWVRITWSTPR